MLLLTLAFAPLAARNAFVNPPPDSSAQPAPMWQAGSIQQVAWETDWMDITLFLLSDPPGHNFTLGSLFAASTDPTSPYDFDMSLLDYNVHCNFYFQFLSAATGEAFYSAEFLVVAGSSPSAVKLDTFTVSAQFKTEVYYSQTTLSWTSSTSQTIPSTTDARRNTSLAAVITPSSYDEVLLFYISTNNSLSTKSSVSGVWTYNTELWHKDLPAFKIAPDSRSLSVKLIPNTTTPELCILFEGHSGNITALHGQASPYNPSSGGNLSIFSISDYTWTWQNISYNLYTSSPNTTFCPPFANALARPLTPMSNYISGNVSSNLDDITVELCTGGNLSVVTSGNCCTFMSNGLDSADVALQAVFYDPNKNFFSAPWYQNGSFHSLTPFGFPGSIDPIPANVPSSDIAVPDIPSFEFTASTTLADFSLKIIWVNATGLVFQNPSYFNGNPTSPFPYKRLAVTTPSGGKAFYFYHQINASILAEDIYDLQMGSWTSTNISIPTV